MTQLYVDNLANEAGTGPTTLEFQSAAKAFVFSDAAATIQNSLNVSSATDIATGEQSWSFTNDFSDNLYGFVVNATDISRSQTNGSTRECVDIAGYGGVGGTAATFENSDGADEDPSSANGRGGWSFTTHGTLA